MHLKQMLSEEQNDRIVTMKGNQTKRRRFAAIMIAGIVLASAFAFAACTNTPSANTPTDPDLPDITNPNNPDKPTTEHSALLYDVLTDRYYRDVVDDFQTDVNSHDSQLYDPIPYGFLEKEGYNINDIKNDVLEVDSVAYTKENEPNNLYVATRVETKGETPYYTCYTLKYSLSDLEMQDLKFVHNSRAIESPLFIQESSYRENPIVISKASISIRAYNNIVETFKNPNAWFAQDKFGTMLVSFDLNNFSIEGNTVTCTIRPQSIDSFSGKVNIETLILTSGVEQNVSVLDSNKNVYTGPYFLTFLSQEDGNDYLNNENIVAVTYYDTQNKDQYNFTLYDQLIGNKHTL